MRERFNHVEKHTRRSGHFISSIYYIYRLFHIMYLKRVVHVYSFLLICTVISLEGDRFSGADFCSAQVHQSVPYHVSTMLPIQYMIITMFV